jgi:hypothetical protein
MTRVSRKTFVTFLGPQGIFVPFVVILCAYK